MLVYEDVFSDKEVCTDTYPCEVQYDGTVLRFTGKLTTEKTEVSDSMLGGNKSAEGGDEEQADDVVQSGVDIVLANRLAETAFTKKDYKPYIKEYISKIIKHVEKENADGAQHDVGAIKKGLSQFVAAILGEFDKFQFFISQEDDSNEGMVVLCKWDDESQIPYLYFFKHGLREIKC